MTALLTDNLPLLAGAPNGIKKLRELILQLAVMGKLVPQDPTDEPASELLKRITAERALSVSEGKSRSATAISAISDEETPFKQPFGWEWARLQQIIRISSGDGLIAANMNIDGGIPVFGGNGINGFHDKANVLKPTLVIGRVGYYCGSIHITPNMAWVTDNAFVTCFSEQNIFLEYLCWLLKGTNLKENENATAQPVISGRKVYPIVVGLPPLAEQHRIVAKVDELMALCDLLETQQADAASAHAQLVQALLGSLTQASDADDFAVNWQRFTEHFHTLFSTEASIDALKQTLLQLAVMGKLVPQDPTDEPASEMLKRIQVEKLRLVAEGKLKKQKQLAAIDEDEKPYQLPPLWQWSRLGSQVIESGAGWSPSCEPRRRDGKEWGVLKVSAVSWGLYRPEENKALPAGLDPRPEHEVAEGDFLVSRANTAELVARSVVVENTPANLMLSDKIVRLKLTSICDRRYVNFVNSSAFAREYYGRVAAGTSSSMKNVSREQILGLLIPLPPLAEQHRIVAKVDQLMVLCDRLKTQLSQARQLNQQLATSLVEQAVA